MARADAERTARHIESVIDELRPNMRVKHQEMSLVRQNGCVQVTLMAQARRDADIDVHDPGNIDEYYYADHGIVILDLEGTFIDGDE